MRIVLTAFAVLMAVPPLEAATLLVGNKSDDTVDLVDVATGKSRATLPTGNAPHEITASPDGRLAVVSNYGDQKPGASLTVVDVRKARIARTIQLGEHSRPHGVQWLSGDRVAVTTEGSAHLLVVDVKAGTVEAMVPTASRVSHMVALTPDGKRAFVANIGSGSVTAIDLMERKKLRDISTGAGAEGIAVTPHGNEVWVTNREADTLSVIDAKTLEVLATIPCAGFPIRIAFTPDGRSALVSSARSGEVVRFDVASRKEAKRAKLDLSKVGESSQRLFGDTFGKSPVPIGLQIARDGRTAYVAATQSDVVVVIDPETLAVQRLLKAGREPDGMALVD